MSVSRLGLALAIALQLAILGSIVAQKGPARFGGEVVLLKVAPYDPYSVLAGYYATLTYEISDKRNLPGWDENFDEGTVYVVLMDRGPDGYVATAVYDYYPGGLQAGAVVIRGYASGWRVEYGIESYFVPEAQRHDVDRNLRESPDSAFAEVGIDSYGVAALRSLHLADGAY